MLLDDRIERGQGEKWLENLLHRNAFPPIIYLARGDDPALAQRVVKRGAIDCLARERIDHRRMADVLRQAIVQRRHQLALLKTGPEAERLSQFGSVTIRGHRFVRELAIGGTSAVYLAESERAGEMVVLKVLRDSPTAGDEHTQFTRFLQEYELISKVRHPNVVRIFDLGIADDHAYLAMEYFPRGDLRSLIASGLDGSEALSYLAQMAAALQVVHAVGVLHRDLKPGNIMLRADGSVALIDFGLAKHVRVDAEITATGEIFGTPVLHEPGAGARPVVRRAQRSVQPRRDLLRDADAPEAVPRPVADGRHLHARERADPAAAGRAAEISAAAQQAAGERSHPSARFGERAAGEDRGAALNDVLVAPTPQRWFEVACERWRELLVDHANCEKKAASTALSLIFAYADDLQLTDRLSRLAREELRHFEQVQKMMQELGVPFVRQKPARYADGLRAATRRSDPGRLIDLLLCGALIEARSYERFVGLAPRLQAPLGEFYGGLAASEARHYTVYVRLAEHRAGEQDWRARLKHLAEIEAELATSPDPQLRFHSGRCRMNTDSERRRGVGTVQRGERRTPSTA